MSALIRNIFRGWTRSESFWDKDGMDDNLRFIGDHLPLNIVTINGTRPTYGATEGDCHIYTSTGRYSVWSTGLKLQQPSWNTYQPSRGLVALHAETGDLWGNTGSAWVNLTEAYLDEDDVLALIGASLGNGTNTTVTGNGSAANKFKVNVATATDTVPGVSPLAVAANYPSTADDESVTPAYVAAALDDAGNLVDGTNTAVTGTGTTADPFKVNVATATDTVPGIASLAVAANYPSTSDVDTVTPAYVTAAVGNSGKLANGTNTTVTGTGTIADPFKVNTPTSTLAIVGVNYRYADETGATTVIQPGQLVASVAGNALTTAPDGRLVVQIPAQLPDDQVFSGDSSGTVALTLTPVVDPATGNTNYTIKADLKLAATTPSGATNMLKYGPSGFYVEPLLDVFE